MTASVRTQARMLDHAVADFNPWRNALQESAYEGGYLKGSIQSALIQLDHGLTADAVKTLRDALAVCEARRAA